ncbi:uncharacterized protein [Periplaneta americana]|uniref:uncharacterized protein n=1 Tax=Periplaneta americana TaxID=6978 RepID=UPI0037E73C52
MLPSSNESSTTVNPQASSTFATEVTSRTSNVQQTHATFYGETQQEKTNSFAEDVPESPAIEDTKSEISANVESSNTTQETADFPAKIGQNNNVVSQATDVSAYCIVQPTVQEVVKDTELTQQESADQADVTSSATDNAQIQVPSTSTPTAPCQQVKVGWGTFKTRAMTVIIVALFLWAIIFFPLLRTGNI